MPATVERLEGEPIVVATLTGHLTIADVLTVYQRTSELRQDMPAHIYRVTDVRATEADFAEMMKILKQAAEQSTSSTVDPTVTVVFVGKTGWAKLFIDAMRQQQRGGVQIPVYHKMDDALAYIRNEIQDKREAN